MPYSIKRVKACTTSSQHHISYTRRQIFISSFKRIVRAERNQTLFSNLSKYFSLPRYTWRLIMSSPYVRHLMRTSMLFSFVHMHEINIETSGFDASNINKQARFLFCLLIIFQWAVTTEGCMKMFVTWQVRRTIGPLTFHSQEISVFKLGSQTQIQMKMPWFEIWITHHWSRLH